MSTGKVILGSLAGLAIGAIAGVLLAPDKGSVTRKKIMDKGESYADELKSKYESSKRDLEGFVDRGKAKYDEAKKDVKNAAAHFKHDGAEDVKNATS